MTDSKGVLYLVSTPIGNLGDITYRAINILNDVSLIAAEDTRYSKKLLNYYQVETKMISYFEYNRDNRIPFLISNLVNGLNIAVITDAGTPGISDPAYKLVRKAIGAGVKIESIPGPSAFLAALTASGLPTDRFLFEGFLPPKKGRNKRLSKLQDVDATIIYYESAIRLKRTLNQLYDFFGDRPAVVARELTKMYEQVKRGTLLQLSNYFSEHQAKGECVILIGKDDKNVYFK
ncbi:MAG: 16S rRNA (cytidine(1402)-2'-O)-methyltransferase [Candidatus Neomarinimicrobiota bacterium]